MVGPYCNKLSVQSPGHVDAVKRQRSGQTGVSRRTTQATSAPSKRRRSWSERMTRQSYSNERLVRGSIWGRHSRGRRLATTFSLRWEIGWEGTGPQAGGQAGTSTVVSRRRNSTHLLSGPESIMTRRDVRNGPCRLVSRRAKVGGTEESE